MTDKKWRIYFKKLQGGDKNEIRADVFIGIASKIKFFSRKSIVLFYKHFIVNI